MLHRFISFISFLLLLVVPAFSTNPQEYADSLKASLPNTFGESRFDLYHRLAEIHQRIELQAAILYSDSAFQIANSLNQPVLLAKSYHTQGKLHHLQGQYFLASQRFGLALLNAQKTSDDKLILLVSNALGISHLMAGNYEEAFVRFSEVEKGFRKAGKEAQVASTLLNIGSLYHIKGEPDKAIKCYSEALQIAKEVGHQEIELKSYSGLGKSYEGMGDYENALEFQQASLRIGEERNYPALVISSRHSIGQLYQQMNNYPTAEKYYREALEEAQRANIPLLVQSITLQLGRLAWNQESLWEALTYMEKAENLAEKLGNDPSLLEVSKDLSGLHADLGNYPKALQYHRRYHDLMIDQQTELNKRQVEELSLAFGLAQTERRIAEMNQEKIMERYQMIGLLLVATFALLGLLMMYQRYRERQRSLTLLSEQHHKIQHQNDILQEQNHEIEEKNRQLAHKSREINQQNKALSMVNLELAHFARAASHDLREPLRTIRNYMNLLGNQYDRSFDTRAKEFLTMASAGAVRMEDLLNDLHQYAQIGRTKEDFREVDLARTAQDVVSDLQATIQAKNASVILQDLPIVRGIRIELRVLLQNLISNAIKFYPPDTPPKVWVSGEEDAHNWIIRVEDQGIGIDPSNHDKVFEIFERLHAREEFDGSGIGLATCKKIVQHHGGDIHFESRLGFGTVFTVRLPKSAQLSS